MLGRKQSLKGEPVLADYGPEESLNESADIEWVNKVSAEICIKKHLFSKRAKKFNIYLLFFSYGFEEF